MAETDLIMNMKYAKNILSLKPNSLLCVWLMVGWGLEPHKNEVNYSRGEVAWKGSHLQGIHFKAGSVFWLSSPWACPDIHFQVLFPNEAPNSERESVGMFKICFGVDKSTNEMFSEGIIGPFQHLQGLIHVSGLSSPSGSFATHFYQDMGNIFI